MGESRSQTDLSPINPPSLCFNKSLEEGEISDSGTGHIKHTHTYIYICVKRDRGGTSIVHDLMSYQITLQRRIQISFVCGYSGGIQ